MRLQLKHFLVVAFTALQFSKALANSTVEDYTAQEKTAVKQLRYLVEPELYKDFMRKDGYLVRWIRDQKFDVEKAHQKLTKALKWRKDNKIDAFTEEDLTRVKKRCEFTTTAKDKMGRPVLLFDIRKCSLRNVALKSSIEEREVFGFFAFELSTRILNNLHNDSIQDLMIVLDTSGVDLREHACVQCLPIAIATIRHYENYYPRLLHRGFAINVSRLYSTVYNLASPFMSEHFRAIYTLHGYEKVEWQPLILKEIDADQLPKQFGGTRAGSI